MRSFQLLLIVPPVPLFCTVQLTAIELPENALAGPLTIVTLRSGGGVNDMSNVFVLRLMLLLSSDSRM